MRKDKLLVVGLVWPEPTSSAAGWRLLQILDFFQELGYEITFVSAAVKSERSFDLASKGINEFQVKLNHSEFDEFIKNLNPKIVLFDRFISEEQFGWRVSEQIPDAIRILDSEDFHGLRKAREIALKEHCKVTPRYLQNDVSKRELASMYRCDLTLVISEEEMHILSKEFEFPMRLMFYLPFVIDGQLLSTNSNPDFDDRQHLMTIGNYLHAPNTDAIVQLKHEIWPLISRMLPNAELHIYGAYQSNKVRLLHNEKERFLVKGAAPDAQRTMRDYKLCLAPLRFGAGLKGKLFDAMISGTPSIMTTVGAEGMFGSMEPAGEISDNFKEFAEKAVQLYSTAEIWRHKQTQGYQILRDRFEKEAFRVKFKKQIEILIRGLQDHRESNFIGQLLMQQTTQASKFLSKWIEAKNS